MKVAALIVAGGRGTRASVQGAPPKQYALVGGRSVLARTVSTFTHHAAVSDVQVVIGDSDEDLYRSSLGDVAARIAPPVVGGASRQASVLAGLEALVALGPGCVLIHDAVRPFVDSPIIDRVIGALRDVPGAVAGIAQADTLKVTDAACRITSTLSRDGVWRAQTPQGFHFDAILAAHRKAAKEGITLLTDDAAVAEWAGIPVVMVAGSTRNVKLTTMEDIALARLLLEGKPSMEMRTGSGLDVHRFGVGDHVWLCGVKIAFGQGLEGHSDADVALHALTDAVLGAIGAGDIGQHFPPSDPKWRGVASRVFLGTAMDMVRQRGGRLVNADVTIICEAPKIGPHRTVMCQTVAEILATDLERVNVKATTTEALGFTGRREGIAAMATATISLPSSAV